MMIMLQIFILFLLPATLFVLVIYLGRKESGAIRVLLCLAAIGIWSIVISLPIENWLFTFDSPESVIQHSTRDGEVIGVVRGNESYLIRYSRGDENNHLIRFIARRTEEAYKLPTVFGTRRFTRRFEPGRLIEVHHVRNTNDYYIIGLAWPDENGEITILDKDGEDIENMFLERCELGLMGGYARWFYIFVEGFTDDFYLIINGERVAVVG